jgi:hypothetical protein
MYAHAWKEGDRSYRLDTQRLRRVTARVVIRALSLSISTNHNVWPQCLTQLAFNNHARHTLSERSDTRKRAE